MQYRSKHINSLVSIIMLGCATMAHGHERPSDHTNVRSFMGDQQKIDPITPFGYEVGAGEEIVVVGADGEEYVVSGEEEVGADDVEKLLAAAVSGDGVGARRRMRVVKRGGGMRKVVRAPIHVPGRRAELINTPLGFDSGADINAGATLDVAAQPQADFWGRKLMIPSDIAGNFAIVGVRVGMKNVLPGTAAIPARAYDERSNGGSFLLPRCAFGYSITITVANIGGGPARFRAVWEGMINEQ